MCSIISFKTGTEYRHEDKIKTYFNILKGRGDQSYGYIFIQPDGDIYFKKSLVVTDIVDDFKEVPADTWVFLHARKASPGMTATTYADKLDRAHPVESNDKSVILLHNGTKQSLHAVVAGSVSDSQAMATLLSKMYENRKLLYGQIGVMIYEINGDVHLYKDGMRPLVMHESNTIFASEPVFNGKWKNIKNTYGPKTKSKGDVILKLSEDGLGLTYGKPVDIEFEIATITAYNSVIGEPKVAYCSVCKKQHLKNKLSGRCCTCYIEVEGLATPTTLKNSHKTTTIKKADKFKAIISESASSAPLIGQKTLYGIDIGIVRKTGVKQEDVKYGGVAIVRCDNLYRDVGGLLYAIPKENGKYVVKCDRLFANPEFLTTTAVLKTGDVVDTIYKLDKKGEIKLNTDIDMSICTPNANPSAPIVSQIWKISGALSTHATTVKVSKLNITYV